MEENKQALLKIFALVMKDRAKLEHEFREISPAILRFFGRKELIEIITNKIHNGTLPPEINLMEMENSELLALIGDDMYIISYVTEKWCDGVLALPTRDELNKQIREGSRSALKGNTDSKHVKKGNEVEQQSN